MDVSKLHNFGWKHEIDLEEGSRTVYDEFAGKLIVYKPVCRAK